MDGATPDRREVTASGRRRRIAFAVLTVAMAVPWVLWSHLAAGHVRRTNTTRVMAEAMFGGHGANDQRQSPLQSLLRPRLPSSALTTTAPPAGSSDLGRRAGWVELVAWYWERGMYCVGAGLIIAGVLAAAFTRWSRAVQILAGLAILAATAATLVGLNTLSRPSLGDLPPLSPWTYVIVGTTQSGYGWVLLLVHLRRSRAEREQACFKPGAAELEPPRPFGLCHDSGASETHKAS
ncbi:MAG TPA: hypothetical protein VLM89_14485 [Phycisphaerae bacterium]|nr:hypothetical protein [Phycisphaerae bacterium]